MIEMSAAIKKDEGNVYTTNFDTYTLILQLVSRCSFFINVGMHLAYSSGVAGILQFKSCGLCRTHGGCKR